MMTPDQVIERMTKLEDRLSEIRRQTDARLLNNRSDFNSAHALATTRASALEARIATVEGMVTNEPLIELTALINLLIAQSDENHARFRERLHDLEDTVRKLDTPT